MNWPFRNRRPRSESDLDDEIRFHLETEAREQRSRGLAPADADAAARRAFGNVSQVKEVTRQMWGWTTIERFWQDVRYALRSLRHSPAFAITAVLSLALGIGANISSFTLADTFLLRLPAITRPSEVVSITSQTPQIPMEGVSYPDLRDMRERSQSFSGIVGYTLSRFAFAATREEVPQMRMGMLVSQGFFSTLGIEPALGRGFTSEESGTPGRDPVTVISYDFWQQQFAADTNIIGSTIRLNGVPFNVIGVAPRSFTGMDPVIQPAMFVPVTMAARLAARSTMLDNRAERGLNLRARLKPGVTIEQAQSEAAALAANLAREFPDPNRDRTFRVRTERQLRISQSPPMAALVAMLVVLSLMVLVIACANAASLLLARSRARFREVAVRLAIGAGRGRLIQQFLTESLVVALLGGVAGLALAWGFTQYLSAIRLPTDTPMVFAVTIDGRVLAFSLAVSLMSAMLFGLVPSLRAIRPDVAPTLKGGDVQASGRSRTIGRSILVSAQVALTLVLLVASTTLLDAFRRMLILNPGIRTAHIMLFEFEPGLVGYSQAQSSVFFRQLIDRTRALPGVRSATLSRAIPFRPNFTDEPVVPEGFDLPRNQRAVVVATNVVDEEYFRTAGTEILAGRGFKPEDTSDSRRIAVVNQEFASRYWSGKDALGRRFRLGADGPWIEVAGVARTAKYLSLAETPQPYVYLPLTQNPRPRMSMLVETEGSPIAITDPVLRTVHSLDSNIPVFNVRPFDTYYENGVLGPALIVIQMVGSTGLIGLALALVGLYGLIAYSVTRRTREIGIRMAIGANRWTVLALVLRQGLTLSTIGVGAGVMLSIPVFRLLSTGLAGVGRLSPWTLLWVPLALLIVTVAACSIPAWRASRIDPTNALRSN